jgi:hypothetical protein
MMGHERLTGNTGMTECPRPWSAIAPRKLEIQRQTRATTTSSPPRWFKKSPYTQNANCTLLGEEQQKLEQHLTNMSTFCAPQQP